MSKLKTLILRSNYCSNYAFGEVKARGFTSGVMTPKAMHHFDDYLTAQARMLPKYDAELAAEKNAKINNEICEKIKEGANL